ESASHSAGTSRPSLNWSGSSTSKGVPNRVVLRLGAPRRHLLGIAGLPRDGERDVLLGERLQGRVGDEVLAGLEDAAGEAAEEKGQSLPLGGAVLEGDDHHGVILACFGGRRRSLLRPGIGACGTLEWLTA